MSEEEIDSLYKDRSKKRGELADVPPPQNILHSSKKEIAKNKDSKK